MDLEISTSKPRATGPEYVHSSDVYGPLLPSTLPPPSLLLKKENEPWRGPSAFGMANILNRTHSVTAPPPSQQPQPHSLPKFSLPSLHAFGKPLITKQEPAMNRVRSILNEPSVPASSGSMSDGNVTSTSESSPLTTSQTPSEMNETPRKVAPSRRIAPAPTDEDDGGEEDTGPDSIRGGRWSSEEHDRFLAGFRIHGHKWKRVQQVVRTRSVTQVRTHAQKYLLKLAKLKGEKKPDGENGNVNSSSDTESTHNHTQDDGDKRSPRKKMRRYDPTTDSVDEEYITAAASTLCFLMRQKIDSLFDSRMEDEKDLEPYDCYSNEHAHGARTDHSIENSRKRPYMHFITDNSNEYSYSDEPASSASGGSPNGYSIDGKQLCS